MDYSLLVGLHFQETSYREASTPDSHHSGFCSPIEFLIPNHSFSKQSDIRKCIFQEVELLTMKQIVYQDQRTNRILPGRMNS